MSREMKHSGIPWIGEIPKEWNVNLLSLLFYEHKQKNVDLTETNLLSLSYGKIVRKDINTKEGLLPESFDGYNIISNGDIVFRLTDLQNDKRSLRTGLCKEKGIITSAYVTIRGKQSLNSTYYHYLFHSYDLCKVFYGIGDGVRQGMNFGDLRKLLILLPPLSEQQKIASYLDRKCSEIDEMVVLQEKIIEELKAYKQSVITEAVTKGLNPDVPMKDSGIEWIGEIPESWEYDRLKHLFVLHRGYDLANEEFVNQGIPVYGSSGFMGYHNEIKVKAPNVIIGRSGSTGKLHYVEDDFWAHNTGIYISDSKGNIVKYLYYVLSSIDMDFLSTKTAVPTLDRKKIQEYSFVYTNDVEEQQSIASYLDEKCSEIDSLISIKQSKIESLKEYKKSIIYEYVTGKKEVE